jgi:WD40 repeat protein
MGVVYAARQITLNRDVALKMVLGTDRIDPKGLIRFLAEAEAVAAVKHPHVVDVYEFGDVSGRPFLAMEILNGGTLGQRLRTVGQMAPADAARLAAKLARAVQAAHDRQIVHRDLKPGNVLFDDAGEPRVTDFGLAKRAGGSDLTNSNAVMGTPAYMAPEQAKGGSKFVGPPADVWALGTILYECLTGRRAFEGEDGWAVMHLVLASDPTPPRRLVPAVPQDLELICLKCLAKEPHERYPSASELASDLERFEVGEPVSVRAAGLLERGYRWTRKRPWVAGLAAALAVSLVVGAVASAVLALWALREAGAANLARGAADARRQEAEADRERATTAEALALSRQRDAESDREKARLAGEAATAEKERTRDLLFRQYSAATVRGLDEADPIGALVWSAEGIKEAAGNAELEREHRTRLGAALRRCWGLVGAWPADGPPRFLPAGESFVLVQSGAARRYAAADGRPLLSPTAAEVSEAVISPRGRYTLTYRRYRAPGTFAVWETATAARVAGPIATRDTINCTAFAADESRLAVGTDQGRVTVYALPTGSVAWELPAHPEPIDRLEFDTSGTRLVTVTRKPFQVRRVLDRAGNVLSVNMSFSPFDPVGSARAWDLTDRQPLGVSHPIHQTDAAGFNWAGEPVALVDIPGEPTIGVRDLATGAIRFRSPATWPEWAVRQVSFDVGRGRLLATRDENTAIHIWDLSTGKPACPPLAAADRGRPWSRQSIFSPDGRRLAAVTEGGSLRVHALPGGAVLSSPNIPLGELTAVAFSPDGSYLLTGGTDGSVRVWNTDTGAPVGWPLAHPNPVEAAGFSPDGMRVWAVARNPATQARICCVWECPVRDGPEQVLAPPAGESVTAAGFVGDLVVAERDEQLVAHDLAGVRCRPPIPLAGAGDWSPVGHEPVNRTRPVWSPDLSRAAVVTGWGSLYSRARIHGLPCRVELWNWAAGRKVAVPIDATGGRVTAAEFSAGGDRLLTVYEEEDERQGERIELWDTASGALVRRLQFPGAADNRPHRVGSAYFAPDGRTVIAGGWVQGDRLLGSATWDAASGTPGRTLRLAGDPPVAISPDGRLLLTSEASLNSSSARLWELGPDQVKLARFIAGQVTTAEFGPGGLLATIQRDGHGSVVRVRAAGTGQPVAPAVRYPTRVWKTRFDPSGSRLLVVTEREVQVLSARSARPLTPKLRAPQAVLDARFAAAGDAVIAVLAHGGVVKWECAPLPGEPAQLARLAGLLAGRDLDGTGTPVFPAETAYLAAAAEAPAGPGRAAGDSTAATWAAGERSNLLHDLTARADTNTRRKDFAAAEADWTRIIDLAPADPRPWIGRGKLRAGRLVGDGSEDPAEFFRHWDAGTSDILHALATTRPTREDKGDLNEVVWALVRRPDAGPDRYATALRLAEAARGEWKDGARLNTLGVARYRAGDARGAIEALSASDLLLPRDPANLAFLAMAHHRLSDRVAADNYLARARRAAAERTRARDPEAAAFMREAEAMVKAAAPMGRETAPTPRPAR